MSALVDEVKSTALIFDVPKNKLEWLVEVYHRLPRK